MAKYFWMESPRQTIQYDVLHYLERGAYQGCAVVRMSKKTSRPLDARQVTRALQALKQQGLVEHDGRWTFTNKDLRVAQDNAQRTPAQKDSKKGSE